MDNLKYIRQTLERAGSFTAVPGKGGMLMGVVARGGRSISRPAAGRPAGWLAVWTVAAVIAMAIGLGGAALKSGDSKCPCSPGPGASSLPVSLPPFWPERC